MSKGHPAGSRRVIVAASLAGAILSSGCQSGAGITRTGNPEAGAITIARQACGSCHVIPGIEEAGGHVGPSLAHFSAQQTIAGKLPNTPDNLVRFLKKPSATVKDGAMPDLPLTDDQARNIAAYLEGLE